MKKVIFEDDHTCQVKATDCNRTNKAYLACDRINDKYYLLMGDYKLHRINSYTFGDSPLPPPDTMCGDTTKVINYYKSFDWYEFDTTKELFEYLVKHL